MTGDLRRYRTHYEVTVMLSLLSNRKGCWGSRCDANDLKRHGAYVTSLLCNVTNLGLRLWQCSNMYFNVLNLNINKPHTCFHDVCLIHILSHMIFRTNKYLQNIIHWTFTLETAASFLQAVYARAGVVPFEFLMTTQAPVCAQWNWIAKMPSQYPYKHSRKLQTNKCPATW